MPAVVKDRNLWVNWSHDMFKVHKYCIQMVKNTEILVKIFNGTFQEIETPNLFWKPENGWKKVNNLFFSGRGILRVALKTYKYFILFEWNVVSLDQTAALPEAFSRRSYSCWTAMKTETYRCLHRGENGPDRTQDPRHCCKDSLYTKKKEYLYKNI